MRWISRPGLLFLLAAMILAGCAETAGAPQNGPGAVSKPVWKSSMATGGISGIIYLPAAIAHHAGYFREQGIEMTSIDTKGGADAAKALIGGSVDFANMSVEHALKAKAQGTDLVVVAGYTRLSGLSLLVDIKLADKVKSIADLKGKRIGVTSLGSGTHMALNALLSKASMKPSDVEVVAVGSNTMIPAMENGSIHAAISFDPFAMKMVMEKKATIIFDLATEKDTLWLYGTEYPFTALVTRSEVISQKPELVQRMVNAVLQAHQFIQQSNETTIAGALPADYSSDGEVYLRSLQHSKPILAATGRLTKESLEAVLQSMIESDVLDQGTRVEIDAILDMSFVEKASKGS